MVVVITTLKIIGIALVSILALVLLIAGLVLFVPVRYRVNADRSDPEANFQLKAQVTYLLHIISVRAFYDKEFGYSVRVFGIKIRPKKTKEEKPQEAHEDLSVEEEPADYKPAAEESAGDNAGKEELVSAGEGGEGSGDNVQDEEAASVQKQSVADRIEAILDKILSSYEDKKDKIAGICDRIRYFEKMANDAANKRAFDHIRRNVLKLLKKIAPKKIRGFVHFGFEDPATTGKILMYLALIYPSIPRKLKIDPGWEDTDIFGKLDIKGHIALFSVLVCFAGLFFDKDCRRLYRKIRHKQ